MKKKLEFSGCWNVKPWLDTQAHNATVAATAVFNFFNIGFTIRLPSVESRHVGRGAIDKSIACL
jgi:hypothetical protein